MIYKKPIEPSKDAPNYKAKYDEYKNKLKVIEDAKRGVVALINYRTDTGSEDYAKRSLVFGSSEFSIETSVVRYYIHYCGRRQEINY